MVYVPGGVPCILGGALATPQPTVKMLPTMSTRIANAKVGSGRLALMILSSDSTAMAMRHIAKNHGGNVWKSGQFGKRAFEVVSIVRVAEDVFTPLGVLELGLTVQVARIGAPAH